MLRETLECAVSTDAYLDMESGVRSRTDLFEKDECNKKRQS